MASYVDGAFLQTIIAAPAYHRLFDDDGDGVADVANVASACEQASSEADSLLLEGWPDLNAVAIVATDPAIKRHIGWIALHFRAQSKPEWRDANGVAPYRAEYVDAEKHLGDLAKARLRTNKEGSAGTAVVGKGRRIGPTPVFTMAISKTQLKPPGGF